SHLTPKARPKNDRKRARRRLQNRRDVCAESRLSILTDCRRPSRDFETQLRVDNGRASRSKIRVRAVHVSAVKTPAKAATEIRRAFPPTSRSTSAGEMIRAMHLATSSKLSPSLLHRSAPAVAIRVAIIFSVWSETKTIDAALRRK